MTGHQWLEVLTGIAVVLLLTWLLLIGVRAVRHRKDKLDQLAAAYRRFSPSGASPRPNRRLRVELLVLAVLVIVNVVSFGLLLSQSPGERAAPTTSTQGATRGAVSPSPSPASDPSEDSREGEVGIDVDDSPDSTRPFQTAQIRGTYPVGANIFLRVERWEGGEWVAFPVPTKTDQAGQFIAHVEFGQPGRYRLRVLDPESGATSKPFVLVVKG